MNLLARKIAAFQADQVQSGEIAPVAERVAVGDEIGGNAGHAADEGVGADAGELDDGRATAADDEIADGDVAGDHGVVGKDAVASDVAIVADVRIGEEGAAVANDRFHAPAGGARVHGHPLADQAVGADRSVDSSPRYFRSCGSWPMEAKGKMRVRAPILVCPASTTCDFSFAPSPSSTWGPMWQNGPISTSAPSFAPSSMTAVGWTCALGSMAMGQSFSRVPSGGMIIAVNSASAARRSSTCASPLNFQTLPLKALDFDESLDDRKNIARFCRGTQVIIEIANTSGGLRRHPRGAARILTPKYDLEKQQLTLEVGDLIALLNFKEPTNSDKTEIITGEDKSVSSIISNLLFQAGITSVDGSFPETSINYPLNLSGSYLQSAGKLLYANNRFGWIDNSETFQIQKVNFNPSSNVVVEVGKDEIWYRRLGGAEQPCTTIKAVGTGSILRQTTYPRFEFNEKYGVASLVDASYGNYRIIIERIERYEFWDKDQHQSKIQTLTYKPLGLVVPETVLEAVFSFISNKTVLIEAEYHEEFFNFEKDAECKLKTKIENIYSNLGNLYSEIILAAASPAEYRGAVFNLKLSQQITTNYDYDSKDVITKITTTTNEHLASILKDTGENWSDWDNPDILLTSNFTTEEYKQLKKGSPGTWGYETSVLQSLVRINPDIAEGGQFGNKTDLVTDDKNSNYQISNSGQLTPPAPERCPVDFSIEEVNLEGKATFNDPCESNLKPRERTYNVEFLAGSPIQNENIFTVGADSRQAQLDAIASREGKLLFGRWKGQEIASTLKNAWFEYYPLMGISAVEVDGDIQNYLVDGASWVVGQMKALVSCDGIWLGSLGGASLTSIGGETVITGGYLSFPYPEIAQIDIGIGLGTQFNSYPYLLETTTTQMPTGMGIGLLFRSGFVIPTGMGLGLEMNGQFLTLYWEDFDWDSTGESIWNALQPSQTWESVIWDEDDWNAIL